MATTLLWRLESHWYCTHTWGTTCIRNPPTSPLGIVFLGAINYNFVCRQFCRIGDWYRQDRAHILNAKGWDRAKTLDIIQQHSVKPLLRCRSVLRLIDFSRPWHCMGMTCCGGISKWHAVEWLRCWHSLHPAHKHCRKPQTSCGKATAPIRMTSN